MRAAGSSRDRGSRDELVVVFGQVVGAFLGEIWGFV